MSAWVPNAATPCSRASRRRPARAESGITEITAALLHHLRRDRIPAIVRNSAAGLGDRSLVEIVESGDVERAVTAARTMFAFEDATG